MSFAIRRLGAVVILASLGSIVGCGVAEDPQVVALRQKFVLVEEPAGATTIAEAMEAVASDPAVVIVGRIGAGEHETFQDGAASFLLVEIPEDAGGHGTGHDASNCPFCKRRAAQAPTAAIDFVDEAGETIRVDARTLFGIEAGDTVVIRGRGKVLPEIELFKITADGIHVRKRET